MANDKDSKKSPEKDKDKNFKFAASLIKVIAVVIALMVIVVSRYAFIFFSAAMLPTIFAIFFDRNHHKCLSATICSFNLIGVLPYLLRMWESNNIDYIAKQILASVNTWMVIYGAAVVGHLIYISLPLLIAKIYMSRVKLQVQKYQDQSKTICDQWGIEIGS